VQKRREAACSPWAVRWFLEDSAPLEAEPGFHEFFEMYFMSSTERAVWATHEVELLSRWTAERPGTRPPSWWRLVAPEGRHQVDGPPIMRGALHDQVDAAGLPLALGAFHHGRVAFESSAALLKRRGLFIDGEAERVPRSAYKPVWVEAADPRADEQAAGKAS
jgi:hypothetical protein